MTTGVPPWAGKFMKSTLFVLVQTKAVSPGEVVSVETPVSLKSV
jgi:hypothetical protein